MRPLHVIAILLCLLAGPRLVVAGEENAVVTGEDFFTQRVEPVLRKRCYECHSHSSGAMEGGLTLDWRSGWATGGSRGPAIMPGDPGQSLLIRAIRHNNEALRMPEEKLPGAEIEVLVDWVKRGAPDPRTVEPQAPALADADWWSLKPLERPALPGNGAGNPVDAFIHARLEQEGLQTAPPADRRTLIRRLTFNLHGLPPTLEETQAFIADEWPDAYARLASRLLDSPRYGERWARHWLDVVHFADTHGFEHDLLRPNAWRYRDYVIDRLNRDVPWARFIREQLAADVFFPESPELTPALGFLGAGPYDSSAAKTAPKSFDYLDTDDLVTQTMGAFVSTTANCARCHAHKFDPITQEDYFALQAVFAGITEGDVAYDADPAIALRRRRWESLQEAAKERRAETLRSDEATAIVAQWETEHARLPVWQPLEAEVFLSAGGATLKRLEDNSLLVSGPLPEQETTTVTAATTLASVTAVRLDALTDKSLPRRGPGRAENGNLHLTEFELRTFAPGAAEGILVPIKSGTADFEQAGYTIAHSLDGDLGTAWGIHPRENAPHHAVFELETPLEMTPGTRLAVILKQLHPKHSIGRFQLSVTDGPAAETIALPAGVETALRTPAAGRTQDQQLDLAAFALSQRAGTELARLAPMSLVYAAASRSKGDRGLLTIAEPREIRILRRGDMNDPGEVVGPGALSSITALPGRFDLSDPQQESSRRAALADWFADPRNPLTWRSIANRVWQYHFGRGLCDTPSDFGRMGGLPSHPELLDWLACELRDGGSLKELHRLICASETYQRSAAASPDLLTRDPDNRLLARMPRQRLDSDSYVDAVLAASGRLDLTMGGPGVSHFSSKKGPQDTPALNYNEFDWDSPGATRRSIYRIVWRGIPDPLFETLDFPDLGLPAPVRSFSASPLQSLVLLNNRFVLHHAEHLARRAEGAGGCVEEQVRQAVRSTWLREPTEEELRQLTTLAAGHGLPTVCRLLLNSNEFLFVE